MRTCLWLSGAGWCRFQGDHITLVSKCAQSTVRDALKVSGKKSESEAMPLTPDHLKGHTDRADFPKLSPEGQERVRQKEPLNRVAIAEGVRQPPDHLKLAKSHFLKMTAEQRTAFDEWRSGL